MTVRLAKVEIPKTARQMNGKKPSSAATKGLLTTNEVTKIPIDQLTEKLDPNKPLSYKAKLFAKLWAQGESVVSASVRSGLGNGSFGYRLTRYPQVIAIYEAEKKKYEEASQMTRKKVMDGLLEGIEMAKLEGTSLGVISGWREIGKMCGYYEPIKRKLEISVTGNVVMERINRMTDAELLQMIQTTVQQDPELIEHVVSEGDEDEDE